MTRKQTVETKVLENIMTGKSLILKRMVWRDSFGNQKSGWFRHGKYVNPEFHLPTSSCVIRTAGRRPRTTEYVIVGE